MNESHQHHSAGIAVTGTCEFWVNVEECVFRNPEEPEPQAIFCAKPARFSRRYADGTTQALCLRHRIHLLRIHISVTIEDWIQANIDPNFCWCGWFRWRRGK